VPAEPDNWKWVLRSSAATRTILQWRDGNVDLASGTVVADSPRSQRPRGLVQVTNGALQPGSSSNHSDSPATAISYDQGLGAIGRLLLAGQMSYQRGASGAGNLPLIHALRSDDTCRHIPVVVIADGRSVGPRRTNLHAVPHDSW